METDEPEEIKEPEPSEPPVVDETPEAPEPDTAAADKVSCQLKEAKGPVIYYLLYIRGSINFYPFLHIYVIFLTLVCTDKRLKTRLVKKIEMKKYFLFSPNHSHKF